MRRDESSANNDADTNPGSGASGPGERDDDEESLVGDDPGTDVDPAPERQADA
jgi:hypothetical protein